MQIIEVKPVYHYGKKKVNGKQKAVRLFLGIKCVFDDVDSRLVGMLCVDGKGKAVEPQGHVIFCSARFGTYTLTEPHRPELDESTAPVCGITKRLKMEEAAPLTMDNAVVVREKRVKNNPACKSGSWTDKDVAKWFPRGDGTNLGRCGNRSHCGGDYGNIGRTLRLKMRQSVSRGRLFLSTRPLKSPLAKCGCVAKIAIAESSVNRLGL